MVISIYEHLGYPKPIEARLYNQSSFLFYNDKSDAEKASEIAMKKWDCVDEYLKHPSYCSLGLGCIEEMGDGTYCVHVP